MKFSAILSFVAAMEAGLLQSAAQTLVITTNDCSSCPEGTYCTTSIPACHGPTTAGSCFNATINEYQMGCAEGYECYYNMCECVIEYPTETPTATPMATPMATPTSAPTTAPPTTMTPTTMTPTSAPATTAPPTTTSTDESTPAGVYTQCPSGTYWEVDATACRGPSYAGECYNPATAKYQDGCAPGFTCSNNKCSTIPPATFPPNVCYVQCSQGEYCENGTNFCRGPNYAGECFNPATGLYQNGCYTGFSCVNNECS